MRIWVNVLTRNESRYLWFSVMSVVDHVDHVLIWDDGSVDDSRKIILELQKYKPDKIIVKLLQSGSTPVSYPDIRQKMLQESECDWIILVDADEVWWDESITKLISTIRRKGNKLDSIVNSYKNVIGDIYHFQSEEAGMYTIDGKRGHLTIRAMNKHIPGLRFDKPHGQLCLLDENGVLIQDRNKKQRANLGLGYLHFTNMRRSDEVSDTTTPKRAFKYKFELGKKFPNDYFYPEVFFRSRPSIVKSPWEKMSRKYFARAMVQTPIKKIKRKFIHRVGY